MSNPELGHDNHDDEAVFVKSKTKKPSLARKIAAGAAGVAVLGGGAKILLDNESSVPDQTSAVKTEAPTSIEQTTTTEAQIPAATEQEQAFAEKIANGESFDVLYGKIAQVQVAITPDKFISYEINDPIELKGNDGKVIGVMGLMQADEILTWQATESSSPQTGDVFRPITVIFGEQTEAGNSTVDFAGLSKSATLNFTETDEVRTPIDREKIGSFPTTSTKITKNESGVYSDAAGMYPSTATKDPYRAGSTMTIENTNATP